MANPMRTCSVSKFLRFFTTNKLEQKNMTYFIGDTSLFVEGKEKFSNIKVAKKYSSYQVCDSHNKHPWN